MNGRLVRWRAFVEQLLDGFQDQFPHRQATDTLLRIADLQNAIATMPARTLPEAAVHLRRLAALFEGWDNPLRRLLLPDDNNDGETAHRLLASALAAVEAAEAGNG